MTAAPPKASRITAAALAVAVTAALPLLMVLEGDGGRVGYLDIVKVPTYCYGGTGPEAKVGKVYTPAECKTQLARDAKTHADGIAKCITVAVPAPSLTAFVSFSYNVGVGGFCKSSLVRKLNAGDLRGACAGLSAWTYAGGKQVKGLVNRRKLERDLCEKGLA